MQEVIFIGLPGPTHHYGGLSGDNVASRSNRGIMSNPRQAALEALGLVRLLKSHGVAVGLLPPQLRPFLPELRKYYSGDDASVIEQASGHNHALLAAMTSSASMWVANAATVTPAIDNDDGKLHITIANLHTNLHRRIEALTSYLTFRQIFRKVPNCAVEMPLDAENGFRDEGAANHMRLALHHAAPGLNVMVYGTDGNPRDPTSARQNIEASQELIRKHKLSDEAQILVKQNPRVIEQGVFHNDVIAVSNENMLLAHAEAFSLGLADIDFIADSFAARSGQALCVRMVQNHELTVQEAVSTYFFNSQLVTLPSKKMVMIAPQEVKEHGKARLLMESIVADSSNPIAHVEYIDLRQSMRNGGGPACLRLRVPMTGEQVAALENHSQVMMSDARLAEMEAVITRTYPDALYSREINHALYLTCREALAAIGACLGLDLLPV